MKPTAASTALRQPDGCMFSTRVGIVVPEKSPNSAPEEVPEFVVREAAFMHPCKGKHGGFHGKHHGKGHKGHRMWGHHGHEGHHGGKGYHGYHGYDSYPDFHHQPEDAFMKSGKHFQKGEKCWEGKHKKHHMHGLKKEWKKRPRCDIVETSEAYVLKMNLPGLKEDSISVHNDTCEQTRLPVVTLEGHTESPNSVSGKILLQERATGYPLKRRFIFPADASHKAALKEVQDGVLTLTIPKRGEEKLVPPTTPLGQMTVEDNNMQDAHLSPVV